MFFYYRNHGNEWYFVDFKHIFTIEELSHLKDKDLLWLPERPSFSLLNTEPCLDPSAAMHRPRRLETDISFSNRKKQETSKTTWIILTKDINHHEGAHIGGGGANTGGVSTERSL